MSADDEVRRHNIGVFMEDGPRLSWRYQTAYVAKDTKRNRVMVGGLGAMGIGRMWVEHGDHDPPLDEIDVPEVDSPVRGGLAYVLHDYSTGNPRWRAQRRGDGPDEWVTRCLQCERLFVESEGCIDCPGAP